MKRFIDKYLLEWKLKAEKPLLIRGARQVGKTFAVRELGKTFDNLVEINFELEPKFKTLFEKDLKPERIIQEISLILDKTIIPGKTLLFFDEIQAAPNAISSLRYFYEMMRGLHIIAAGSLLDFSTELIGLPVGRVESFYMYPMSFIEFLRARRKNLGELILSSSPDEIFSEVIDNEILTYLGEYLIIGGMPEVVGSWINERNINKCIALQQSLIDAYRQDFNKYAKKNQTKYLDLLFEAIPSLVGRKFKFSNVSKDYQKRELAPALDLLQKAGIIHKIIRTDGQGLPFGAQADLDQFKLIFFDVALGQAVLGLEGMKNWLINPKDSIVNKGEVVEAFVGQEMLAYSNPSIKNSLYYWQRTSRGSEAEVDYLVQKDGKVIPVEVKSGKGNTLQSMKSFLESHTSSSYGIRFSIQQYSYFDKVYSYSLYNIFNVLNNKIVLASNA